ncbi:MAG: Rid family detoxifying hydrolase [Chloroflexota bacterium]|nr:Rid family detoxifying hydrolase [Chloroflexota bacterium]
MRDAVDTDRAPAAVGPYSQAIRADGLVFTSGMGGIDPRTRRLVDGGAAAEARQALENIAATLEAAGSGMDHVVRVGLFLLDMADFNAVNEVYRSHFREPYPARTTVAVRELPAGLHVEIDCVARLASS